MFRLPLEFHTEIGLLGIVLRITERDVVWKFHGYFRCQLYDSPFPHLVIDLLIMK